MLPPLKPIPIKDRLPVLYVEKGNLDVCDGWASVRAVDTNVLARFYLQDDRRQARVATDVLAAGDVFVPKTVIQTSNQTTRGLTGHTISVSASPYAAVISRDRMNFNVYNDKQTGERLAEARTNPPSPPLCQRGGDSGHTVRRASVHRTPAFIRSPTANRFGL